MDLETFNLVMQKRIPTPAEFVDFAEGMGWKIVLVDGKPILRAPGGKGNPLATKLALMLSREPYRTRVLELVAPAESQVSQTGQVEPNEVSQSGTPAETPVPPADDLPRFDSDPLAPSPDEQVSQDGTGVEVEVSRDGTPDLSHVGHLEEPPVPPGTPEPEDDYRPREWLWRHGHQHTETPDDKWLWKHPERNPVGAWLVRRKGDRLWAALTGTPAEQMIAIL